MPIKLNGSTSGYTQLSAPATAGNNTLTLPTGNGSSGQVLATDGSGNLSWANGATAGPAFSAKVDGGTQSVTGSTNTKILLNTKEFDTASCFNSSRFTPTVAGYYRVSGSVSINAPGYCVYVSIFKNGSEYKRGVQNTAQANHVSALIYLNGTTDYVELYSYAGSTSVVNADPALTWFDGHLARPA